MINVKDQVYEAIKGIAENVGDTYPTNWGDLPAIQYTEEDNSVYERTSKKGETKSKLRYRVDIWHNKSTSEFALAVDAALSKLGLVRTMCMDVPDPSQLKHKQMRYEGIIDVENENVYFNK